MTVRNNLSFDARHEWSIFDDFLGGGSFGTAATEGDLWVVADTSAAGTPTYVRVDLGESTIVGALGTARVSFDAQSEVQNVCLSWGDRLGVDFDKLRGFEARVRMGQATMDATSQFACGVTGDRNDAIDSLAVQTLFRVVGADSTTAVVVENDDTSDDNNDIATGTTLINAWKTLRIDFTSKASCLFFIDDVAVATGTTFIMSSHTGGVQPFFQISKTADTNTDSFDVDYVHLWGVR